MVMLFQVFFEYFNEQIHKYQKSRKITHLAPFAQKLHFLEKLPHMQINHPKTAYTTC